MSISQFLVVVPCENQESALELASKLREHTTGELNTVVTPGTIEEFMAEDDNGTLVQMHLSGWSMSFYNEAGDAYGGPKPVIVLERSRPDGSTVPPVDTPTSGT